MDWKSLSATVLGPHCSAVNLCLYSTASMHTSPGFVTLDSPCGGACDASCCSSLLSCRCSLPVGGPRGPRGSCAPIALTMDTPSSRVTFLLTLSQNGVARLSDGATCAKMRCVLVLTPSGRLFSTLSISSPSRLSQTFVMLRKTSTSFSPRISRLVSTRLIRPFSMSPTGSMSTRIGGDANRTFYTLRVAPPSGGRDG